MLESLLVSQLLLWLIVIILAVVCLALARQVGVLYERVAPVGALNINRRLFPGDPAPALQIDTLAGQSLSIASSTDHASPQKNQLLFFLSPDCPICKTLLPTLHQIKRREKSWLEIILASDGDSKDKHRAFVKQQKLEAYSYVVSESLGLAYGISKLPYGVLIDENNKIVTLGLVNTREHLESLLEAKALGVPTIQDYLQNEPSQKAAQADSSLFHPANSGANNETA